MGNLEDRQAKVEGGNRKSHRGASEEGGLGQEDVQEVEIGRVKEDVEVTREKRSDQEWMTSTLLSLQEE